MLLNEVLMADQRPATDSIVSSHSLRIKLDHIASHAGKAQGLVNILRGIGHNARSSRCYIPNDMLSASKARHEDFLRGRGDKKEVQDVCFEIASSAHQELDTANKLMAADKKVLKPWLSIFLPLTPVEIYLKKLQSENFNVFSAKVTSRDTNLPLKLWVKSLRIKFSL